MLASRAGVPVASGFGRHQLIADAGTGDEESPLIVTELAAVEGQT
jgi:hypothetical protein